MLVRCCVCMGLWLAAVTSWAQSQPQIQVHLSSTDEASANANAPVKARIEFGPLEAAQLAELKSKSEQELAQTLKLFVKSAYEQSIKNPVFARVALKDQQLLLEPRFDLQPGTTYVVVCESISPPLTHEFQIPKVEAQPTTVVAQVFPTAEILPQNLLKFYIYFSAPMSQGDVYQHIELATSDGHVLEYPFLEIQEELWDRSGKRLTLLIDPGRVKRGLVPREEEGPVLTAQTRYVLTIKPNWLDANGVPLAKGFTKKFLVGPEDFTQPSPANWRLTAPKAKTRDALVIDMPEPIDHATFARGVSIENAQGHIVHGDITFSQHEARAYFRPLKPWRSGLFDLCVSTLIEDLAGNSIQRPFEVDRFDRVESSSASRKMLTFEVQ